MSVTYAVGPDGTRLHVSHWAGEGPALVLCDGILCDGFIYRDLLPRLTSSHRVVHWNYRGHGLSDPPTDPERVSVQDHARDLLAVLDRLGLTNVVLVGHSFGASVALEAAFQAPSRVAALVLLCGTSSSVAHSFRGRDTLAQVVPSLVKAADRHPRFARRVWSSIPPALASRVAYLIGEVNRSTLNDSDLSPYFEHLKQLDPNLCLRLIASAGTHSSETIAPLVKTPSLVVAGAKDSFIPSRESKRLSELLPNSEFVLLADGTHVCPLEFPESLTTSLKKFLAGL